MKIAEYRAKKGLTQVQLAEKVGVEQASISQYEIGKATPSLPVAAKIAVALDTTVDSLLDDDQRKSS